LFEKRFKKLRARSEPPSKKKFINLKTKLLEISIYGGKPRSFYQKKEKIV